ncbi:MAG: zinc-ribbon domain-containing protein [Planctomycetes bacterium]|nr:zinc-ribbon domain-containing protein [Planctomycetota bacterium]
MIDLDLDQLAPEVAAILMARGTEPPPLQWHVKPSSIAKENLNAATDDTVLLKQQELADDSMAAAVRALLYLWGGWPGDANMFAQAAPDRERLCICALSERQAGHPDEAKKLFREVEPFPFYPTLMSYAVYAIGLGTDPPLRRLRGTLEMGQTWEPFAFIDLYEQARAGKLCGPAEHAVRQIQCREFELLLVHCYEQATGRSVPTTSSNVGAPRARPKPVRIRPQSMPSVSGAGGPKGNADTAKPGPPKPPRCPLDRQGPQFGVLCPKCQAVVVVPESRRGAKEKCQKCGTSFMVPHKQVSDTPSTTRKT